MITIRPIHPNETPAARRVILTVAYSIFGWNGTLEESIRHEEYEGQRIGYALFCQLRDFAFKQGDKRLRLQTSPRQARALAFYRQLGFVEIPCYNEDSSEISMELDLQGTNPKIQRH